MVWSLHRGRCLLLCGALGGGGGLLLRRPGLALLLHLALGLSLGGNLCNLRRGLLSVLVLRGKGRELLRVVRAPLLREAQSHALLRLCSGLEGLVLGHVRLNDVSEPERVNACSAHLLRLLCDNLHRRGAARDLGINRGAEGLEGIERERGERHLRNEKVLEKSVVLYSLGVQIVRGNGLQFFFVMAVGAGAR